MGVYCVSVALGRDRVDISCVPVRCGSGVVGALGTPLSPKVVSFSTPSQRRSDSHFKQAIKLKTSLKSIDIGSMPSLEAPRSLTSCALLWTWGFLHWISGGKRCYL